MSGLAFLAAALGTFVVAVGALGVLPVLLCRGVLRSTAPRKALRVRTAQSQIALLVVLAPVGIYLAFQSLVSAGRVQPVAVGVLAAGVVLLPTGVVTYVWLERRTSKGH